MPKQQNPEDAPSPPDDPANATGTEQQMKAEAEGPTQAELDERELKLAEREEALRRRQREMELAAAEANLDMREADLARVGAQGFERSGTVRKDVRGEAITEPVRQRRHRGGQMVDKFAVPPEKIPIGTSYEWKTKTVFGQTNTSYETFLRAQGWEPVPSSRHPDMMPEGYDGPVEIDGMVLCERPMELTREAMQEDFRNAREAVQVKEQQLYGTPDGQFQRHRANGSNDFIQVNRSVEPGTPTQPNYQYERGGIEVE